MSGLSDLPTILKAPKIYDIKEVSSLIDRSLVYIIDDYGDVKISMLIKRCEGDVIVLFGDNNGNRLDISEPTAIISNILENNVQKFIQLMNLINVNQLQFFFAIKDDRPILVDVQVNLDKLLGPGMLRDLFSSMCEIQRTIKIDQMNFDTFSSDVGVIIKPSRFSIGSVGDSDLVPLYSRFAL